MNIQIAARKNPAATAIHGANLVAGVAAVVLAAAGATGAATGLAACAALANLAVLLVPARVMHAAALRRWHAALLAIAYQGKWLGLWTAFWFFVHAALRYTGRPLAWDAPLILTIMTLAILALLAAMSNKWSYAHIKYWKHLNMLVWLLVPFTAARILLRPADFGSGAVAAVTSLVLAVCIIVGISGLFRQKPDYFARWRVWLMAVGAVLAWGISLVAPVR